ncbi:MAG: ribokinase [Chloroflexi bacterium]|nr:ribokinase [Chloroflexota bacterium]
MTGTVRTIVGVRHRTKVPVSPGRRPADATIRGVEVTPIDAAPVVVVVGSLNVDQIAYTSRVPAAGETVMGDRYVMGFGGKGANQAVMARRLGAGVEFVGALGEDVFADMTIDNMAGQGIDTRFIARVPGSSGVAPIWVEPDGTNRIIVVAGANDRVEPGVAADAVRSLERVDVVVGQLEIPQAATAAAFGAARQRGVPTILNPAPAAALDSGLLAVTDWLIPNETEFAILAGEGHTGQGGAGDRDRYRRFAERTGTRLVVTLGSEGALLVGRDGDDELVPATPVTPIDTTGAGDAFVGAFAYGLAAGLPELEAVRLGVALASDSVTKPGTQTSFATPERAAELLGVVLARI